MGDVTTTRPGSVVRLVTLLELISAHPHGIGVREAARLSGIDRSAVGRILAQLETLGCAEQESARGVYVAGDRLYAMAAALRGHDSLPTAARPMLEGLVERFSETCYLVVRHHDAMVFRDKVDCRHPIRHVIELGRPFPLATAATGTAILAGLPDDEVEDVLARARFERYTSASLMGTEAFRDAVREARRLRYAVSFGRWVRNGAAIASPFFGPAGQCVGALALNCPADRMNPPDPALVGDAVRQAAADLSRRIGCLGDWHASDSLSETAS
jgi:DNA-binding IclR family transcriptional regulator